MCDGGGVPPPDHKIEHPTKHPQTMPEGSLTNMTTILLCACMASAVWSDMRQHRIPNNTVIAVLCVALASQVLIHGALGALYWLGGAAVGLIAFLPFYAKGGMGAGDVKLMAAAGAAFGPIGAALICATSLIAGLPLAVAAIAWRYIERRFPVWQMVPARWSLHGHANTGPLGGQDEQPIRSQRFPYALAIAVGTVAGLWWSDRLAALFTTT